MGGDGEVDFGREMEEGHGRVGLFGGVVCWGWVEGG